MNTFADRFKQAREHCGLSLAKVADRIGVTAQAAWNYENRPDGSVATELLFPLADTLNVEARWLATGEGIMVDEGTPTLEMLRVQRISKGVAALTDEKLQALSVLLGIKL